MERKKRGEEEKEIEKRLWSEETKEEYVRNCERWSNKEEETENMERNKRENRISDTKG